MGAGRRRVAAGAPARRRRRQARRRSLRRARRQDGAARACRRLGGRGRQLEDAARPARRESRRGSASRPSACWPTPPTWQPGELFDAVLLDAPCSSTGTIRRHPDIPYTKSPKDIVALAALQARLLDNAARLVKPGGRLVYSTCSLEPEEGEAQIAALLVRNEALSLDPIGPDELFGQEAWIEPSGCLADFSLRAQARFPRMERDGRLFCHTSPRNG